MKSNTVMNYNESLNDTSGAMEDLSNIGLVGKDKFERTISNGYKNDYDLPDLETLTARTLITGAAGFIGSNYVAKLITQKNFEINEMGTYLTTINEDSDNGYGTHKEKTKLRKLGIEAQTIIITDKLNLDELRDSALLYSLIEVSRGSGPSSSVKQTYDSNNVLTLSGEINITLKYIHDPKGHKWGSTNTSNPVPAGNQINDQEISIEEAFKASIKDAIDIIYV